MLSFEVKEVVISNTMTKVLDFIAMGSPYTACQNIQLSIDQMYELEFSFIIDKFHDSSTLYSILNNKIICNITSTNNNISVVGFYKFRASQQKNTICFNTTIKFKSSATLTDRILFGPLLDNVTLIRVVDPTLPPNTTTSPNNTLS